MAGHGNGVLYVLYHGDTCLGVGTPEQIECEFGIKKKLLKWYACPSVQRRNDIGSYSPMTFFSASKS